MINKTLAFIGGFLLGFGVTRLAFGDIISGLLCIACSAGVWLVIFKKL